ncbi:MAG: hypothetical protein PUE94_06665 [Lachnospiraceae bacterium]|nr:hypothetical protein [Lachnospiraceae bacterium]
MKNAEIYKEYKKNMEDLSTCLHNLRSIEDQMVLAASNDDAKALDDLVRKSQPDLLRFRGLDQERNRYEKVLGITGLTFREILEGPELDRDFADQLRPVLDHLSKELSLFKESKDNADRIMKVRLLNVNRILDNQPLPEPFHETLA